VTTPQVLSEELMSRLDRAAEIFEQITAEYAAVGDSSERESEARMRVIDRILFECLEWPRSALLELSTSHGDESDYILRDAENTNWIVVEAKRPNIVLANTEGVGKDGTQKFKLGGAAFNFGKGQGAWPIFAGQVSKYAVAHGTCLAIVTNGRQWVASALPSRSGRRMEEDHGVVFADLDAIRLQFERFYNYFSVAGVRSRYLEQFLADDLVWATVQHSRPSYLVAPGSIQPLLPDNEYDEFHRALERALTIAFSPVEDDPELLAKCFVETRFSQDADDRLSRLTEHLATQLTEGVGRYEDTVRERSEDHERGLQSKGHLVLLSGQKSAGKTTYLGRFFGRTLRAVDRQKIRHIHVRLDRATDLSSARDVHRAIADVVEKAVFSSEDASVSQGQFFDLYQSEWTTHKSLYGEEDESRREFIREHRPRRDQRPLDYVERLLKHTARRHGKLPCLSLDGWDHLAPALQQGVLEAATTLFLNSFAIVTVVADDTTLWKARNESLDRPFADYVTDKFWLPRPKIGEVLDNRLDYLQEVFSKHHSHSTSSETHLGKGKLRWKFDAGEVSAFLRDDVLFAHDDVRNWIGELANHDLRSVLALVKRLILSPALKKEPIFKAFVSGDKTTLSRGRLLTTLIRPNLNRFREDPEHVVHNIFDHRIDNAYCPMAPAMILAMLEEKGMQDAESGLTVQGFLHVQEIVDFAEERLRIPQRHVFELLAWLAEVKLIEPYDPSTSAPLHPQQRVKILPRGSLHLRWAKDEWGYLREMAYTHPIVDDASFDSIHKAFLAFDGYIPDEEYSQAVRQAAPAFVGYLLGHVQSGGSNERPHAAALYCDAIRESWLSM